MSDCTFKVGTSASVPTSATSNVPISQHNVGASNVEPKPFVGSYLWRKHFAKDGPAPRNEEGMVIGRDT